MLVNVNRFTLVGRLGIIEGYGNQCAATVDGQVVYFGIEDLAEWVKRLEIYKSGDGTELTSRFKEES